MGRQAITRVLAGEYDAAAVREQIAGFAGKAGVVVFSQTSCPFCKKAKELLDSVGAKYDVVELDTLGAFCAVPATRNLWEESPPRLDAGASHSSVYPLVSRPLVATRLYVFPVLVKHGASARGQNGCAEFETRVGKPTSPVRSRAVEQGACLGSVLLTRTTCGTSSASVRVC
jgi:thiol-disulfide isomerase/thioredoxin